MVKSLLLEHCSPFLLIGLAHVVFLPFNISFGNWKQKTTNPVYSASNNNNKSMVGACCNDMMFRVCQGIAFSHFEPKAGY